MIKVVRELLRQIPLWVMIQELRREGIYNVFQRLKVQRKILNTTPVFTEIEDEVEIHVLTWRKDYINLLWSLKTFYYLSDKKFPLVIHDGGLGESHKLVLKKHFPNCRLISRNIANEEVETFLLDHGYNVSNEYRKSNVATLKVFDYFYYSRAKRIIHIDSDIVFFKKPDEFLNYINSRKSVFNKDMGYAYSTSIEELKELTGLNIPPLINSGLFVIDRESIDLKMIEKCLSESSKLFDNKWVTEQTLHAICATQADFDFLSEHYLISTKRSNTEDLVCKHYTGFFRPLFYQEGLKKVIDDKILNFL